MSLDAVIYVCFITGRLSNKFRSNMNIHFYLIQQPELVYIYIPLMSVPF